MAAPMTEDVENILNILNDFKSVTCKPNEFLAVHKSHAKKLTKTLKTLYDSTKSSESTNDKSTALPTLIVDSFDDEQIWQELELQNEAIVTNLLTHVARLLTDKGTCSFKTKPSSAYPKADSTKKTHAIGDANKLKKFGINKQTSLSDENINHSEDEELDHEADSDGEISKIKSKLDTEDDKFFDFTGDSDDDLNFDFGPLGQGDDESEDEDKPATKKSTKSVRFEEEDIDEPHKVDVKGQKRKKPLKKGSSVDDAFFKLSELEEFLVQEDRREERKQRKEERAVDNEPEEEDDDDDDQEIDMFADLGTADEDLHYEDFFDPPDGEVERSPVDNENDDDDEPSGDDDDNDDQQGHKADGVSMLKPAGRHNLLADSDSEGEDAGEILSGRREHMSSYEQRQQKLKKKISQLEDASLDQKPWQLAGEITAANRPENSLLQESVQFDHTTRQAPEITEETTKTLEDLVRQRIKDKAWDDVERKVKPKDNPFEYKKRLTLDQEKSKLSLGEIYEQEFLKQQKTEKEEEADPDHEDIKKSMQALFIKLDALSNFHYTPKQVAPEVRIVSNQPSISIEEVAPVSVSENKLLAPQEVQDKQKGELKGDTEKTKTDKFRERKQKKSDKRQRQKDREQRQKLIEKLNPGLGNKYSKEKAMRQLEKESKTGKGVTMIKEDKKTKTGLTSSKSFFTQLQDEVTTGINSRKAEKRKKDTDKQRSSKKYKL